jgi:SAM-dependent methyltransferase
MKPITYDIEWKLEKSHWWFIGRRKLLKLLLSSLHNQEKYPVIDIGCGVGSNLGLLKFMGFKVIGIDSEIYSLTLARKHISGVPLVNGNLMKLPFKANSIGLVIATDILEHLNEDTIGIKEIYRTLKWGGVTIFTVPAFEFLWGIQDIVGMHQRRYSKKEFIRKVEHQGFRILRSSYFNFFLFFPILIARRLIRLLGLKIESENEVNFLLINFFLKAIISSEIYLLNLFSLPFGVSIFCVAQKVRESDEHPNFYQK